MLNISKLTFGYNCNNVILNIESLHIANFNKLAIVGESGCGKSTLLKIFSGLLPSNENNFIHGEIAIDGLSPTYLRDSGKIGYVFQNFLLLPFLNVKENILWPIQFCNITSDIDEKYKAIVDSMGIQVYVDKMPYELSGGMQARVAIARSLITDPKFLMIDEAFSSLDIGWRSKLYNLIEEIGDQNKMKLIFISHNIDDVISYADKCLILHKNSDKFFLYDINKSDPKMIENIRSSILNY